MFTTLKRIVVSGLKTFWRNSLLTSSSILTITITLVAIISVFLLLVLAKTSLKRVESKVDINIYFTTDAQLTKILEFKDELYKLPDVDLKKTQLLTKEETLEDFRKKNEENNLIKDVLGIIGENPLGAVMNVKAKDITGYKNIIDFLESDIIQAKYLSIIDSTNYNENRFVINKIRTWIKYIKIIGIGGSLILILISLVIVYNTMRLIMYSYKEEIQVMKLIGASNFYARGPFLIEGILYGVISGVFATFISWTLVFYTKDLLKQIFVLDLNKYFSDNILYISGGLILGGVIISFISTYFTVAKYLKIEDVD